MKSEVDESKTRKLVDLRQELFLSWLACNVILVIMPFVYLGVIGPGVAVQVIPILKVVFTTSTPALAAITAFWFNTKENQNAEATSSQVLAARSLTWLYILGSFLITIAILFLNVDPDQKKSIVQKLIDGYAVLLPVQLAAMTAVTWITKEGSNKNRGASRSARRPVTNSETRPSGKSKSED